MLRVAQHDNNVVVHPTTSFLSSSYSNRIIYVEYPLFLPDKYHSIHSFHQGLIVVGRLGKAQHAQHAPMAPLPNDHLFIMGTHKQGGFARAPLCGKPPQLNALVKGTVGPILRRVHIPMFNGVVMDVIHVPSPIFFILNGVFPKAPLPHGFPSLLSP